MNKSKRVAAGVFVVVAAVVYLIFSAVNQHSGVEITIADIYENPDDFLNKYIVLEGNLDPESIEWNPENIELSFTILDESGNRLSVLYNGIKPDGLYKDVVAIVKGKYDPEKDLFIADTLQTRCPSKYESPREADGE